MKPFTSHHFSAACLLFGFAFMAVGLWFDFVSDNWPMVAIGWGFLLAMNISAIIRQRSAASRTEDDTTERLGGLS